MQELNMMEVDQVVGGYRILAKTGDIFGVSGTFYLADAILSP